MSLLEIIFLVIIIEFWAFIVVGGWLLWHQINTQDSTLWENIKKIKEWDIWK